MKKEYIEALRELFDEDWPHNWTVHTGAQGLFMGYNFPEGRRYRPDDDDDAVLLCRLIDEALIKRKDVTSIEYSLYKNGSAGYCIYRSPGPDVSSDIPPTDPLTARLEALVKL
ncbi:MAG: hypothetical protein IH924_10640, partial [Proteobacteria bacterium]|nr:hypothetical protein [Pseudomonadota bacterium]